VVKQTYEYQVNANGEGTLAVKLDTHSEAAYDRRLMHATKLHSQRS